jgi:short subunit dehydrogenase-like uncharacterized protein
MIAWKLAARGIPFIAAGRNAERLAAEMRKLPELEGHDYQCVAVNHDLPSLTALFQGRTLVLNVVGPFMQLGRPVVEAALAAGCHYFDTTGETDWMLMLKKEFGAAFAARELVLSPANAIMWMHGLLGAEIALETPGIDTLDILYYGSLDPTVASSMSFLRICTKPMYYLKSGQLQQWPWATAYDVVVPGMHRVFKALPWGGGGEPVFYQDDPRVRNCSVLTTLREETINNVLELLKGFERDYRHLDAAAQEEITNKIGRQITQTEPQRETPDRNPGVISVQARGPMKAMQVTLWGSCGYAATGVLGAEAAQRVLAGRHQAVGFASAAKVFGARPLLAALAEDGYLSHEVRPL